MDVEPSFPVSDTLRCDDGTVERDRNFFDVPPGVIGNYDADQCWLPGTCALYIRLNRTLNVTVPDDVEEFIFSETSDIIAQGLEESHHTSDEFSVPTGGITGEHEEDFDWVDFNQTSIWPTNHAGIVHHCLDRGEAGQWSMYPVWVCVNARLVGCDELEEDLVIEACGLTARWIDPNLSGAALLSTWNITEVDPDSMSDSLIRVENATFESGESPRNVS